MAIRLPDVRNIQVADFSGNRGVARLDMSNAGAGLASIGQGLSEMGERRASYQASKARTEFLTGYTSEINSYDERTDYQNFDQDFRKNSEQLLNDAASTIENERVRQEFIDNGMLRIQEGAERVRNQAYKQEVDYERGTVVNDLTALRETAITAKDQNVVDTITTMEDRIQSSIDVGYYSREEGEKLKQAWRVDVAKARIEAMDPSTRIEALKQPWASNLPAELRARIERDAKTETKEYEAISISDSYIDEGLSRSEALSRIGKIKDPELRQSVETRFDYQFQRAQQAEQEEQQQLYDDYVDEIASGKATIDFIPREKWDRMNGATRSNMRALQAQAAKPRTVSDGDALVTLAVLKANDDYQGIVEFLRENSAMLKPSDRVKYAEIAIDGSIPIEVDDGLTDIQIINGKLTEADITDKKAKDLLLNRMGDWRRNYIQRFNKTPDDAERDKFIDRQLMDVVTSPGFLWDSSKRVYEMDDDDFQSAITTIREEDPNTLNDVINYYNDNGYQPSQAEIIETYNKLRERKLRNTGN